MLKIIFTFSNVAITLSTLFFYNVAQGAQCDCQQRIGVCKGAVEFLKGFGSEPSFGAEIAIYSSEKVCSKVEYYVDNTPYQTILTNKSKDTESIFGTSRITPKSIQYSACYICKNSEGGNAKSDNSKNSDGSNNSPFAGKWVMMDRNIFGFTNRSFYNITVNGNVLSGTFTSKSGERKMSGTINGNEATISCDDCFTTTWRLTDPSTISFSYPFGSGTLTKE